MLAKPEYANYTVFEFSGNYVVGIFYNIYVGKTLSSQSADMTSPSKTRVRHNKHEQDERHVFMVARTGRGRKREGEWKGEMEGEKEGHIRHPALQCLRSAEETK